MKVNIVYKIPSHNKQFKVQTVLLVMDYVLIQRLVFDELFYIILLYYLAQKRDTGALKEMKKCKFHITDI